MLKASLRAASGVLTCTQICFLYHENSIGVLNMLRPTVQHLEIYIYKIAENKVGWRMWTNRNQEFSQ